MANPKKKFVPAPKKNIPLIYVGTSFPDGSLFRFRVYANGIPEQVLRSVKNKAALKNLFVTPDKLSSAMLNVKAQGHPLFLCNRQIENELLSKEDR